jgi:hypothetical protein
MAAVIPSGSKEREQIQSTKSNVVGQQSRTLLCLKKLATVVPIFLHLGRQRSAGRMLLRLSKTVAIQMTIIKQSNIYLWI